jgi:putative flavoprotein involved in K+ transport
MFRDLDGEHFDTVIVGGGQAGLSMGYHLARRDRRFVILDESDRIGESWRRRWTSLHLFTPARYDGLPGLPFPARPWSNPTKDEVADYLEAYAARFDLTVCPGVRVDRLSRNGQRYTLSSGDQRLEADQVVVATGAYHKPRVPSFASELDPNILQLHSSEYRDPSQLRDGPVLVVGAGNSGAEIAYELSRSHETWLSGKESGHTPIRTGGSADRFLTPAIWFLLSRVLSAGNPIGRKIRPKALSHPTAPLERVRPKELAAAGVTQVPRTTGVQDGYPTLADGRVMSVPTVIWCTGFQPGLEWIDLPIMGEDGEPIHERGVVPSEPGLYFVGRFFQYSLTSALIGGVAKDAEYIAEHIVSRAAAKSHAASA